MGLDYFAGSKKTGSWGEKLAVNFLKKKGYKILQKNFHSKIGEIDIVAEDNGTLVFVEVKTRFTPKYGKPEESVSLKKLERIKKVGQLFLLNLFKNGKRFKKMRIEVVAIEIKEGNVFNIRDIKVI